MNKVATDHTKRVQVLEPEEIADLLRGGVPEAREIDTLLDKGLNLGGLDLREAALLLRADWRRTSDSLRKAALAAKEKVFGRAMGLFVPLYLSNNCLNDCLYCGFRKSNQRAQRKTLSDHELEQEVSVLLSQGHRHLLLVSSENPSLMPISRLAEIIHRLCRITQLRRVDIEVGALETADLETLKEAGASGYVLFQETYHFPTYQRLHPQGPKSNYQRRITSPERAARVGFQTGLGVLFGLYHWPFEILSLIGHAHRLQRQTGRLPGSISIPRLRPAVGAPLQSAPFPVPDEELKIMVAVLRLTLPRTHMVLSTREPASLRDELMDWGVSQMSAGSRTNPGGYCEERTAEQFVIEDHRSLSQVIEALRSRGLEAVI